MFVGRIYERKEDPNYKVVISRILENGLILYMCSTERDRLCAQLMKLEDFEKEYTLSTCPYNPEKTKYCFNNNPDYTSLGAATVCQACIMNKAVG